MTPEELPMNTKEVDDWKLVGDPITVSGRYEVYSPSRNQTGWVTIAVRGGLAKRISDVEVDTDAHG